MIKGLAVPAFAIDDENPPPMERKQVAGRCDCNGRQVFIWPRKLHTLKGAHCPNCLKPLSQTVVALMKGRVRWIWLPHGPLDAGDVDKMRKPRGARPGPDELSGMFF